MEQNSTMLEYEQVLQKKRTSHKLSGFEAGALNPKLFKFQEFIVRRALSAGKYAVFADCGLGKTAIQLEWAFRVFEKENKPVIILAPLQLQTIERLIHLYSNRGDTVLTPFMGIGSEVYQAVKMGRVGIGFELKESYFEQAKNNCRAAVNAKSQLSMF